MTAAGATRAEALIDLKIKKLHSWNVSAKEAIEIQKRLRAKLNFKSGPGVIRWVAGADVSSSKKTDDVWAGVVVFSYPGLLKMEERWVKGKTKFPYRLEETGLTD